MDDGGVNLKSAGKKNLPVSPKISFVFRQKNSGINFCAIGVRNAPIKNLNVDAKANQQTDIFNKAMNIKNCVSVCDVKSAYSQKIYIYWVKHIFFGLCMMAFVCLSGVRRTHSYEPKAHDTRQ